MSLSSLIVERGIATMREVEEALARQVLYGGDLVTNLLEVAALDEGAVARLLAESFNLLSAPSGELPMPGEAVSSLVPVELAARRSLLPFALDSEENLVLVLAEPLTWEEEEQLSFALGRALTQQVAPLFRVRQALSARYGLPLERRFQRLLAKLEGKESSLPNSMPPLLRKAPAFTAPPRPASNPSPGSRLTPAFGSVMPTTNPTNVGFPPTDISPPTEPPIIPTPIIPASVPPPAPAVAPESIPPPVEPEPPTLQAYDSSPPEPVRRRRGPLLLDTAERELDRLDDRDALLKLFFEFVRQFFDYSALFLVRGDLAEGRDAFGSGASRDRVMGIGVPLDMSSVLAIARDRRAPVHEWPSDEGLDAVLLADLERHVNHPVLILPLLVKSRVVALLYADGGDAEIDDVTMNEVCAFSELTGQALERVIVKRKLHGFSGGSSESQAGRFTRGSDAVPGSSSRPRSLPPPSPHPNRPSSVRPEAPPPMGVMVRRPSGPPIPREEPPFLQSDSDESVPVVTAQAIDDAAADALLAELGDLQHGDAGATLQIEVEEAPRRPEPSQAISFAPRRPPSSRSLEPVALPSMIVDADREFGVLVERFVASGGSEQIEAELLRQGELAMPAIMAQFPGPIAVDRRESLPRVVDCGPLLHLIARQRRVALSFVLKELEHTDPERRFWATYLLTELAYAEAVPAIVPRLFDAELRTRKVARLAARALAEVAQATLIAEIGKVARDATAGSAKRIAMINALGEMRQPLSVPVLIAALADEKEEVAAAARGALMAVTRQDFALDVRKWGIWWDSNASRSRVEWLIDALVHDVPAIRSAAGQELKSLTKEYFGYYDDLPKRERERAQQRYREWWISEGRARFASV